MSFATQAVVVTFDRPLTPAVLDSANWIIAANLTFGVRVWNPTAPPVAAGSTVTYVGRDAAPGIGGPTIAYVPPPFDLIAPIGIPAAAFSGFPLTLIP